jgi:hypothetical protein
MARTSSSRGVVGLASLVALLLGAAVPASAGAAWTAPVALGQGSQPQVAVDADGDAVFTWVYHDGTNTRIRARARSAAGVLSPVQTLSSISGNGTYPQIAVDSTGDAVITWNFFDGDWERVQARARSAAGVLGAVQTLTPTGRHAGGPTVGVDTDGDAVIGYTEEPNPDQPSASFRGQARARSAAGVLSPAQTVSPPPDGGVHAVAVDADGDAVFISDLDNPDSRIQARARSAAGALSPIQTVTPAGKQGDYPDVAVGPGGYAILVWRLNSSPNFLVQARTRSPAGALSPVKTLGKSPFAPQVAIGGGDAAVVWNDAGYTKAAFGP